MREKNVKEIVRYYYEIPEMVRLLKTEQREQESLYDTLKGTGGTRRPWWTCFSAWRAAARRRRPWETGGGCRDTAGRAGRV